MTHSPQFDAPPPDFATEPARALLAERLGELLLAVQRLSPGLPAHLRTQLEAWMRRTQDQVHHLDDWEAVRTAAHVQGQVETHLVTALTQASGGRRRRR